MNSTPSIVLSRGYEGKGPLTLTSTIDLGFDRRELVIETKRSTQGLVSEAYVQQRSPDGLFVARAFGNTGKGDFSAVIAQRSGARATEKALRALHDEALEGLDFAKERALRHYVRQAPAPTGAESTPPETASAAAYA